jgi:L-rhamnose mutarotase
VPRYCFTLQVRPERREEYARRHAKVWPEMLDALARSGWRDYRLFLREDGLLVGTVDADDLDAAQEAMAATAVNARWQAEMAPFFVALPGGRPDTSAVRLEQVFDLDAQLTATNTDTTPGGPR